MRMERREKLIEFCQICATPTNVYHFGVLSCNACKMFFKRYGEHSTKFVCRFDNRCDLHNRNRHSCNACRLKKCFQSGMSIERFHASIQKRKRNEISTNFIEVKNIFQYSDRPELTTNDWALLNNLFHCYDESRLISCGQCLINVFRNRSTRIDVLQNLTKDFLESIYETTGRFLRSNVDLNRLPCEIRSIGLKNAAEKLSCMGGAFAMKFLDLFAFDQYSSAMISFYGERSTKLTRLAMKFIEPDLMLIKLAFALITVSSIEVFEPKIFLKIQNHYVELTWKYLRYRYDFHQCVQRYLRLILWIQSTIVLVNHIRNVSRHVNDLNAMIEQVELTLILDDADELMRK